MTFRLLSSAAIVLLLSACSSGPNTPSGVAAPHAASPVDLTVVVRVSNTRFGTAVPSDVKLAVTTEGATASVTNSAGSETGATVLVPGGATYSVTAAPLDGYTMRFAGQCSGPAAQGGVCEVTATEHPVTCEKALWDPVYTKDRLKVLKACEVGTGIVVGTEIERDGDLEIWLRPDANYAYWLRPGNKYVREGALVVEIPCQAPIVQADAMGTCDSFAGQRFQVPSPGDHLIVAAPWVEDRSHHMWGELHGAHVVKLPR